MTGPQISCRAAKPVVYRAEAIVSARHTLTELVRGRLRELADSKRISQTVIARDLGLDPSAVNKTIRDDARPITLEFLEAVAVRAQVPIAELVCPPGHTIVRQLSPDEAAFVRALRQWPASVRQSLSAFFQFFANETPVDLEARNLLEFYRRGDAQDRRILYALAQLLREGMLGPDILEALEHQLRAEARSQPTTREKARRRRETP
jgi:transcriptional regulator with XRE-family HTH domain